MYLYELQSSLWEEINLYSWFWFQVLEEKEDEAQISASTIPSLTPFHFQEIRILQPNLWVLRPEPKFPCREPAKQNRAAFAI